MNLVTELQEIDGIYHDWATNKRNEEAAKTYFDTCARLLTSVMSGNMSVQDSKQENEAAFRTYESVREDVWGNYLDKLLAKTKPVIELIAADASKLIQGVVITYAAMHWIPFNQGREIPAAEEIGQHIKMRYDTLVYLAEQRKNKTKKIKAKAP
jgi:hypothetical protein